MHRLQKYLVFGVLFSLLSSIFYLSEQAHAYVQVFTSDMDRSKKVYMDESNRLYLTFPAEWTASEPPDGILLLTGNQIQVQINILCAAGTDSPCINAPIEEMANKLIDLNNNNNPTFRLLSHAPLTISDVPAYLLSYDTQYEGENLFVDHYIVQSGGILYGLGYTVPESLYNQNIPIMDLLIRTLEVGTGYDDLVNGRSAGWSYPPASGTPYIPDPQTVIDQNDAYYKKFAEESKIRHDKYLAEQIQRNQDCNTSNHRGPWCP
jgi:hypothetical protein